MTVRREINALEAAQKIKIKPKKLKQDLLSDGAGKVLKTLNYVPRKLR